MITLPSGTYDVEEIKREKALIPRQDPGETVIGSRPDVTEARVYRLRSGFVNNSVFITLGYIHEDGRNRPIEIFINSKDLTRAAEYAVLTRLSLPNVRLLRLEEVETPELRNVKTSRTRAEYCWTMTPFASLAVLARDPQVDRVTYVDADFWFMKSPAPLFEELNSSGKQVLMTDHAYSPEYDQSSTSGQYCLPLVTFCRGAGQAVLGLSLLSPRTCRRGY